MRDMNLVERLDLTTQALDAANAMIGHQANENDRLVAALTSRIKETNECLMESMKQIFNCTLVDAKTAPESMVRKIVEVVNDEARKALKI